MRKRGQIIGMPIVYIIMMVMMAVVLFYGFSSLQKVILAKEVTEVSKFVLDLEDDVELMYNYDLDSAKKFKSLALPPKVKQVCFYNPSNSITPGINLEVIDEEFSYYLSVTSNDNLFLIPLGLYPSPYPDYFIENFRLEDASQNPLCFVNTKSGVEFVLETYLDTNQNQIFVGARSV